MHNRINQILIELFGIKFTRIIQPQSLSTKEGRNSVIIEFLGPSGVGKSTLCRYFLKHHGTPFKREVVNQTDLQAYLKGTRFKLTGVQDKVLNLKINNSAAKNTDPFRRFREICLYKTFLDRDFLIRHYLKNKIVFLDEERMLHFFLEEPHRFTDVEFSGYFKNRLFICCHGSTEKVITYIKERARQGHMVWFHQKLNSRELYELVDQGLKNALKRYDKLNKIGAKTLRVNVDEALKKNCNKLDLFIQKSLNNLD